MVMVNGFFPPSIVPAQPVGFFPVSALFEHAFVTSASNYQAQPIEVNQMEGYDLASITVANP